MTRTHDLLITNQLLYRLSYSSIFNFLQPGLVVTNQPLYRLSYTSIFLIIAFCGFVFLRWKTSLQRFL